MTIRLDGRVAIVTGAGNGLGRAHALFLARRGARVVVNDLGGARDGSGASTATADRVVAEIRSAGGDAIADGASVTDPAAVEAMVARTLAEWGRIDILVNNAGVLRDRSFAKMTLEDFRFVLDVHLMGAVHCTKAVWETMREQRYGRIVMTTSSSGLWGNFGQSNYGAAKMALVGLMQTLGLEGEKYDIRVNCLAPTAATRMTADILTPRQLAQMAPENVSPGLIHLVSEAAPNRAILCAGAGAFERAYVTMTAGTFIGAGESAPEEVAAQFDRIGDRSGETVPSSGMDQGVHELDKADRAPERP
jgi:NAD(P)-dependent dehydrogenase (short-subunit alcohol dehydrogenase family)